MQNANGWAIVLNSGWGGWGDKKDEGDSDKQHENMQMRIDEQLY